MKTVFNAPTIPEESIRRLLARFPRLPGREPSRIRRVLLKLEAIWEAAPDLHFGQLVENVCFQLDPQWCPESQWNLEDDRFEAALDSWITRNGINVSGGWKS